MLDREPFLKAIFATPEDLLPRLVFADYLEEQGDTGWAELIRLECELLQLGHSGELFSPRRYVIDDQLQKLSQSRFPEYVPDTLEVWVLGRPFDREPVITVTVDDLADIDILRQRACAEHPEWYGAENLKVTAGRITTADQLSVLLRSPVTQNVRNLDLSGRIIETAIDMVDAETFSTMPIFDLEVKPTITVAMVEALSQMREARRLTELDLTNNELDNDAARSLARSPHLHRLRRLAFHTGNYLKARTWQVLLERFGPEVLQ